MIALQRRSMTADREDPAAMRPPLQIRLVPSADLHARIMAQLVCPIAVSVPLHLSLVDGQNVPIIPASRNDIALPDPLFQMRARDCDILVIGVVRLSLLFDDRPISEDRAKSERPNDCTHN